MDNILEVFNLNKSYRDFSLKNVTFSLPEGCITGFIGVNGAGKTTTLRSVLGLTIETLALPALGNFTLRMAVAVFFAISVFLGVYLPVQFKLGFEKTKFLLTFVIIASPFLFSELLKLYGSLDFYAINAIPPAILCGMIALLSLAVLIVSVSISEKIYSRADL